MPIRTLRKFLDGHHAKYVVISHSTAYTAQEAAQLTHIPGRELAKTVIVEVDGKPAMAVLPASLRADLDLLKEGVGAAKVRLAAEDDFQDIFPDCEIGAMPPFGNIYDMAVFVDRALTQDKEIAFSDVRA